MMMKFRYAEEANYWETTVHPAVSQGEITKLLDDFGAEAIMFMSGQSAGRYAWMIRFQWNDRSYRFAFKPLICKLPRKAFSFGGKRRAAEEQSKYQMARIAVHFVKAILTAAEADPAALFGFVELPGAGQSGIPPTASELDIDGIVGVLPQIKVLCLEDENDEDEN
jgi:hypothetical protein